MKIFLLVAVGGFFGAMIRFLLSNFIQAKHSKAFPFGTFTVNLTGSFILGFLFGKQYLNPQLYFLIGTGFMGAYTTFSTLELEAVELIRKNKWPLSLLYLLLSTLAGIIFAFAGYRLGKLF